MQGIWPCPFCSLLLRKKGFTCPGSIAGQGLVICLSLVPGPPLASVSSYQAEKERGASSSSACPATVMTTGSVGLTRAHCVPCAPYRGPEGARFVPRRAHTNRGELLGALCEGRAARPAHLHLPGLLPAGPAQPHTAPVLHARGAPTGGAAGLRDPH